MQSVVLASFVILIYLCFFVTICRKTLMHHSRCLQDMQELASRFRCVISLFHSAVCARIL